MSPGLLYLSSAFLEYAALDDSGRVCEEEEVRAWRRRLHRPMKGWHVECRKEKKRGLSQEKRNDMGWDE
jgi:hypothetical protein